MRKSYILIEDAIKKSLYVRRTQINRFACQADEYIFIKKKKKTPYLLYIYVTETATEQFRYIMFGLIDIIKVQTSSP